MGSRLVDLLRCYQAMAATLPTIACLGGRHGECLYCNPKWFNYTGFPASDPPAKQWVEALHPEDQASFIRDTDLVGVRDSEAPREYRLKGTDGIYRWFRTQVSALRDDDHQVVATMWIFTDVDELIRSRGALQVLSDTGAVLSESLDCETILKAVAILALETMAEVCLIDLVDEENPAAVKRLVAMHRDLRQDKLASQLKSFPPRAAAGDPVYDVIRLGASRYLKKLEDRDLAQLARSGEHLQVLRELGLNSAIIVPINGPESVFGAVTLARARGQAEYTSDELSLAEEVARRAGLAIENSRLYQRAQRANEAKTEFLANVSHEIRTPLGAILGFTEILRDDEVGKSERCRFLEIIHRNGQQLSELIGELLDLSKIEAGKIELEVSEFTLRGLLDDIMPTFAFKASEKGIRIHLEVEDDVPLKLSSDMLKLRQALINVVGNAIKFGSAGVITIRVRTVVREERRLLAIEVEDQGIGIAPETAEKLFHPFVQADSTMNRRFGGTGLGLALSRRLARVLGGDLKLLKSEPGKGSTFELTLDPSLPLRRQESTALEMSSTQSGAATSAERRRVLVVDDSPDNLMLLERLLTKQGLTVDFARDGSEGIQKGASENYGLILMDIQMPVVDGYTAVARLREIGVRTPIVALTAHALQEDKARSLSAGCDDYVTKPVDVAKLREVVKKYVGGRSRAEARPR